MDKRKREIQEVGVLDELLNKVVDTNHFIRADIVDDEICLNMNMTVDEALMTVHAILEELPVPPELSMMMIYKALKGE